jgi:2-polyprenyl-3-methyl-5-hydroxy-6-metoxy-1,4-benzoquinol methylase
MDLVKQEVWDESYRKYDKGAERKKSDPLIEWIQLTSSLAEEGRCIEIGCYPGGYTNEFGKLGHEISGMDLTPRVLELNQIFQRRNYKVGEFLQKDFFEFKPENKYNIVFSIGFIEHFNDYKTVIAKHCDLVENNGLLLIVVPNFRGHIQHFLHKWLDNENLKQHNVLSMNPKEWEKTLINNNFEIIKSGYIGGFDFWVGGKKGFSRTIRKLSASIIKRLFRKILSTPSESYSPYCGVIARKK